MDKNQLIVIFYKLLDGYKINIDKMKNKPEGKCGYAHSSPVGVRMDLIWISDYLRKNGTDTSKLESDFKSTDDQLIEFKANNSAEYYKNVLCDFKSLAEDYDPSSILIDGYEFEYEIERRTYIEMFYRELKGVYDLDADMEKVRQLDEVLQKTIPQAVKAGTYTPLDWPYIPKEYWWRHLEESYGKPDFLPD
ncbi:hypothetical protein [Methanocella sp. MCL-LM]|uniref:hypothetical protein n=1 Tax=Methanocella sp. MCL-LM TaxID=3412035 RepID=UPI003C7513DB